MQIQQCMTDLIILKHATQQVLTIPIHSALKIQRQKYNTIPYLLANYGQILANNAGREQ